MLFLKNLKNKDGLIKHQIDVRDNQQAKHVNVLAHENGLPSDRHIS